MQNLLFFLGVLLLTCISFVLVDDVTEVSSSSLNDIRQLSALSLSVIVRVALIGLGWVNFCFLQVSLKTFSMLLNPNSYSESESVPLWWPFFLSASCFLITFSSLSIFLHHCAQDCFVGLGFFHFLAQVCKTLLCGIGFLFAIFGHWEVGFLVSILLVPTQQSCVLCLVCAPPCFLHRSQCLSVRDFFEIL